MSRNICDYDSALFACKAVDPLSLIECSDAKSSKSCQTFTNKNCFYDFPTLVCMETTEPLNSYTCDRFFYSSKTLT